MAATGEVTMTQRVGSAPGCTLPSSSPPSQAALVLLKRVLRRDRRVVRDRHAQRLDRARHGVGRVHAAAGTGAGARVAHNVGAAGLVDEAGGEGPCRREG